MQLDDALAACRRLAAHGLASTIGYSARSGESPRSVADAHLAVFEQLSAEELDCYVSVKLSKLGFEEELFGELAAAAARSRRRLHLDGLAPETADGTWRLLRRSAGTAPMSTTLPARWRRSAEDARLAAELQLPVRVVKGEWTDAGAAGGTGGIREDYLRVIDHLREHRHGVAVATHDVPLLAESLRRLTASGTPCEAELFYGMPFAGPARAARDLGVPVRIYVPYGHTGAPYGLTDLRGRPAAAWWLLQDVLLGKEKAWRSIRRSPARR